MAIAFLRPKGGAIARRRHAFRFGWQNCE